MPSPLARLFGVYGDDDTDPTDDTHPTAVADREAAVERDRY